MKEAGSRLSRLDADQPFLNGRQSSLAVPDSVIELGVGDPDHRPQFSFQALDALEDPLLPFNENLVSRREELHLTSESLPHNVEVATGFRLLCL